MLKYTSTIVVAAALGLVAAFTHPVQAQAPKPLVLKGQSSTRRRRISISSSSFGPRRSRKCRPAGSRSRPCPAAPSFPPFEVFDATSKDVLDVGMAPFGYILGRNTATIPMSHGPLFGMDGSDYYGLVL